jgi:hypothetical protein
MSDFDFDSDERNGALFRFWIRMASERPSKIARALVHCTQPSQYRKALTELAQSERINLP